MCKHLQCIVSPNYSQSIKINIWPSDGRTIISVTHCPTHGLPTPGEKIAFRARPKIQSQSQILRYGQSIFCLPHRPKFSDLFWFLLSPWSHCNILKTVSVSSRGGLQVANSLWYDWRLTEFRSLQETQILALAVWPILRAYYTNEYTVLRSIHSCALQFWSGDDRPKVIHQPHYGKVMKNIIQISRCCFLVYFVSSKRSNYQFPKPQMFLFSVNKQKVWLA